MNRFLPGWQHFVSNNHRKNPYMDVHCLLVTESVLAFKHPVFQPSEKATDIPFPFR
jgi:hypothetical protein